MLLLCFLHKSSAEVYAAGCLRPTSFFIFARKGKENICNNLLVLRKNFLLLAV